MLHWYDLSNEVELFVHEVISVLVTDQTILNGIGESEEVKCTVLQMIFFLFRFSFECVRLHVIS